MAAVRTLSTVEGTTDGDDSRDDVLRGCMATLGVYFTLPDQGVTSPEILTRYGRSIKVCTSNVNIQEPDALLSAPYSSCVLCVAC